MPTYKSPRHGVELSEGLHEAAAVALVSRVMFNTFELWHSVGTPEPIYVVNDYEDLLATKEATASRDAGLEVEFFKSSITINRPDEGDQAGTPEISLTVENVAGIMSDAVKRARGSRVPWELIERVYASDDTSGPAILPPMKMYLTNVQYDGETATFKASFGDSVNLSVPKLTFKRKEYPGLTKG